MSILNVNKINPVGGGSTITIAGIASVTSSVTAPSFVGAVTGNVTGNADTASGLSGNPSINTTGIVTATSFVGSTPLSHRNKVINGAMNISQRGTSFSSASNAYHLDRFFHNGVNDGAVTISQSTTSPDGFANSDTPRRPPTLSSFFDFTGLGKLIERSRKSLENTSIKVLSHEIFKLNKQLQKSSFFDTINNLSYISPDL